MVENRGYVFADHLKSILLTIEAKGYKIVGHSWGRTFEQHIQEYINKAKVAGKQFNIEDVPLSSKHLPCFATTKLRAHDFHVEKDGVMLTWIELYDLITKITKELSIYNYGLIVSKIGNWCHLDEREVFYFGYYDY